MSTQRHTNRPNKYRLNITLSQAAVAAGKELAKAENRSFSNTLEVLIDRAYARQFPQPTPQEVGA